uniref:Uncharacterized protein n=1 Tax=Romanomermis culicivorax TaxID=13658 RepID=A0A915L9P8_ROMCU
MFKSGHRWIGRLSPDGTAVRSATAVAISACAAATFCVALRGPGGSIFVMGIEPRNGDMGVAALDDDDGKVIVVDDVKLFR